MARSATPPPDEWGIAREIDTQQRQLVWWLLSGFAAIAIGVAAILYQQTREDVSRLSTVAAYAGERIAIVETRSHAIEKQLDEIKQQLDTIGYKLDAMAKGKK